LKQGELTMDVFLIELKKKIAGLYLENRKNLEELEPNSLASFATQIIEMINREEEKSQHSHDLDVLKESMNHLKRDSILFKNSKPATDEYDFARNDCKTMMDATKKWLKI
jgi:hypothetical protein